MIDEQSSSREHARPPDAGAAARWHISPAPLLVWMFLNLLALMMSSQRVPLWARAEGDLERLAIEQMMTIQLAAAALLLGWLMRSAATALALIVAAGPMLLLAASMSQRAMAVGLIAWAYVAAWMVVLAMASRIAHRLRLKAAAVALAGLLTVGVPLLRYLVAEFSHLSARELFQALPLDPVTAGVVQLREGSADARAFGAVVVAAAVLALATAWIQKRAKVTSYPQG